MQKILDLTPGSVLLAGLLLTLPALADDYADWLDNAAIVEAQLRPLLQLNATEICETRAINDTAAVIDCEVNAFLATPSSTLVEARLPHMTDSTPEE